MDSSDSELSGAEEQSFQRPERDISKPSGSGYDPSQRFYQAKFPQQDELAMVKVTSIEGMGVYVQLLEYGNLEGLILTSELSKRRFRSVTKLVRVGRQEVAAVVRVDPVKGYVDLSKRRVAPEDVSVCEQKFVKAKKVHLIARHAASRCGITVEQIHESLIWPLYAKYGHAYDALRDAVEDPSILPSEVNQEWRDALLADAKIRLAAAPIKLRARVHVSCVGIEAIQAVKRALLEGIRVGSLDENGKPHSGQFTIQLVASPIYTILLSGLPKEDALKRSEAALDAIRTSILAVKGGEFKLHGEQQIIGGDVEEEALEESSSSESGSESGSESEDEDQGMGKISADAMAELKLRPVIDSDSEAEGQTKVQSKKKGDQEVQ